MKQNDPKEILNIVDLLEKEKGIKKEVMFETIEAALLAAYKKNCGYDILAKVEVSREDGTIKIFNQKKVVKKIENEDCEILLKDAKKIKKDVKIDDELSFEEECNSFRRNAIQNAKQIIIQKVREAEKMNTFNKLKSKENQLVNGVIKRIDSNGNFYIDINGVEVFLSKNEQLPSDQEINIGERIKIYVSNVIEATKFPKVDISRKSESFLKKIFEEEIPEIADGLVKIKAIAREAGYRSKVAIFSEDEKIDLIGVCVGNRGIRLRNIIEELGGEKIDLIKWAEEKHEFIKNALNPARVKEVEMIDENSAKVYVDDSQFLLAIGKRAQNVRLAAKLTSSRIDINKFGEVETEIEEESETEIK